MRLFLETEKLEKIRTITAVISIISFIMMVIMYKKGGWLVFDTNIGDLERETRLQTHLMFVGFTLFLVFSFLTWMNHHIIKLIG